jgi:hypothetical protein
MEDFSTLSPINKSSIQTISKETLELNGTRDLMDLTNIHRVFPPAAVQYTFFSEVNGTFFKTDHILGHKANINKRQLK